MRAYLTTLKAAPLALGAAAAIIWAPIAGADDPPACAPDDQQCQDQQKQQQGQQIADQVIDNVQQGLDQANQANQRPAAPEGLDVADSKCTMVDGVPTIIPPTGLILPGSHQVGPPCFMVFGVEPHL
jgi:hypothetical protein